MWPFLLLACTASPDGSTRGHTTAHTGAVTASTTSAADTADTGVARPPHRAWPLPDIALAMAHNAMASAHDDYLAPNQVLNFGEQLELGVRGFMLDIHDEGDGPELCHNLCSIGRAPLVEGLLRFEGWLDDHPEELVVFVLQDEVPPPGVLEAFEASGLARRAVRPPTTGPWPSWNELVDAGEQVLITTQGRHDDVPDWYAHTYDLAFDNDYAATTLGDFDCEVLRGTQGNPFYLLNHFLTAPIALPELADEANTMEALLTHVDACEDSASQLVSWLAVDFVGTGQVMGVVDHLNARRSATATLRR